MKTRKKKPMNSVYFPEEKIHLLDELENLKWKERTTVNQLIITSIEEYCKTHADGNPNFTIEQFQDQKFKACPAFFRDNATWTEYLLTIKDDKVQSKEFDEQLNMLLKTWNKVFNGQIKRYD